MARIVVYSMGHRGDIFPYVPIATELARRGHDVRFVLPREFHAQLSGEPFRCVHSGTDFGPQALDRHGRFLARWGTRFGGVVAARMYFGEFIVPFLGAMFEALDAELASADLLISHPVHSLVGATSCERRAIPWVVGDPHPMFVPTSQAAPAGLPFMGRRVTRALWRVGRRAVLNPMVGSHHFVKFRRHLGLRAPWNLGDSMLSPYLNLGLSSPAYVQPRPDWPRNYRLTGFTNWDGPNGGHVPDDVCEFLRGGDPPVIVTLGTSAASAFPDFFVQAAQALDTLGLRGLFLTSNDTTAERMRAAGVSARHGLWPFVPLRGLTKYGRAIVHSGAHGSNALAVEAGLPSLIVPCLFDQLWHARHHELLGTGIHLRRRLNLHAALTRLTTDRQLTERARAMGEQVRTEDGTTAAADSVEAFLAGARMSVGSPRTARGFQGA